MSYLDPEKQPPRPLNDHEGRTERCPCCGQTYPDARICAPFVPRTSGLLDMVLLAKDILTDLQAALEEEVVS
jgi:hypothetical protein